MLEGYQGMVARYRPDRDPLNLYHQERAREWLVQLYQSWGKPEEAAEWKSK